MTGSQGRVFMSIIEYNFQGHYGICQDSWLCGERGHWDHLHPDMVFTLCVDSETHLLAYCIKVRASVNSITLKQVQVAQNV